MTVVAIAATGVNSSIHRDRDAASNRAMNPAKPRRLRDGLYRSLSIFSYGIGVLRRCNCGTPMLSSPAAVSPARSPPPCSAAPASTPCWSIRTRSIRRISAARSSTAFSYKRWGMTGLADAVLRASTPTSECWVARFGRRRREAARRDSAAAFSTTRWSIPCVRRFQIRTAVHPRQGHRHFDRPRAADRQAVERRRDLRAPRRPGDRAEHRPAPKARHRPRGHQPRPFDLDRLRRPAIDRAAFPFSVADLFHRAAGGPDGLHLAVSDRRDDARQHVRLPRPARSLAEAIPRRAARDALRDVAGPAQTDGRLHGAGLRSRSGRSISTSPKVTGRTASCSSAMHLHRPVPPPAPAPARCWSTSSGSATSTSRAGSRPRAWARQRSPPSTTTRSSWPATPSPLKKAFGLRSYSIDPR